MANRSGSVLKIQKTDKEYVDFPMRYIRAGTYQFTDSEQNLDSYRACKSLPTRKCEIKLIIITYGLSGCYICLDLNNIKNCRITIHMLHFNN